MITVGDRVKFSDEGLLRLHPRHRHGDAPKDWRGTVTMVRAGLVRVEWDGQRYRETYWQGFLSPAPRPEPQEPERTEGAAK